MNLTRVTNTKTLLNISLGSADTHTMKILIISITALGTAIIFGAYLLLKILDFNKKHRGKKILSGDMLLIISTIAAVAIIEIYIATALTLDYFWR